MSKGLDQATCAQAWDLVHEAFKLGAQTGLISQYQGGLVVLNPVDPDGAPIFTAGIGERGEEFVGNAVRKCRLAWREQKDTSRILAEHPYLYRDEDLPWPGGIFRDGLVVAFSGVQGQFDDMISEWMISAIKHISRERFERQAAEAKK